MATPSARWLGLSVLLVATSVLAGAQGPAQPRFFSDDPLSREPETQDASGAKDRDIELAPDLLLNLFTRPGDVRPSVRALNVNTVDEVPDSGWFTNRIYARPVSVDEIVRVRMSRRRRRRGRGPLSAPRPAACRRASRRATAAACAGSCSSTPQGIRGPRPAPCRWPCGCSGRSATTRSRRIWCTATRRPQHRRQGHHRNARRAQAARCDLTMSTTCWRGRHVMPTAPIARPPVCSVPRPRDRTLQVRTAPAPTTPTTSSPTSTAASCAR